MDLVGLDAGAHDWLRLEAGLHLVLDGEIDDAGQVDQGDRGEHRHGQAHEESEADGSLPGPHALHILAHGSAGQVTRSPGHEVSRCEAAASLLQGAAELESDKTGFMRGHISPERTGHTGAAAAVCCLVSCRFHGLLIVRINACNVRY